MSWFGVAGCLLVGVIVELFLSFESMNMTRLS